MANSHSLDLELSSSQFASRADTASLSITGDLTLEFWAKLEQMPSVASSIFCPAGKFDFTADKRSYIFEILTDDKMRVRYSADGNTTDTTSISSNAALSDITGTWTHLAIAVDVSAKTAAMYVNAASVTVDAGTGADTSIHDNDSKFSLGANEDSGSTVSFYDGLIDEARLWNDIRTSTEISGNYQRELNGDEAGLVGYWKLNNGYTDETSNSNDLTAAGSPVFSTDVPFVGFAPKVTFF